MNLPSIIVGLIILAIAAAIIVKGVYNKKHRKGGCGCGCDGCANSGVCHPQDKT